MNRTIKITIFILMLPLFVYSQPGSVKPTLSETAPVATILLPALRKIKNQTKAPILLPRTLPASVKLKEIRFVEGAGQSGGWSISLSSRKGCEGANACFIGLFEAETKDKIEREEGEKEVKLANRISGFYTARSCGNSCAPPQIRWKYKGAVYSIQFNVANKTDSRDEEEMTALANSAIESGSR